MHCESGVKNCVDCQRSVMLLSVKVGHVRASSVVFGNPRCAIVSRDAHIWRFNSERKAQRTVNVAGGFSCLFLKFTWIIWQKDGALEGHNIARTSLRWTCEYLFCRDPCVFAGNLKNAYARARVLSTEQAVAVEVQFREFVIEFVNKCMYL